MDESGNLLQTTTLTADLLINYAITGIVYWNASQGTAVYFADERHGLTMDGQTHLHFHLSMGTQFLNGFALGNLVTDNTGNSNTHAECNVANGSIRDEDVQHDIYDTGGSVNVFDLEQELSPLAQIPVLYREGGGGEWWIKTADNFPFIYSGTAGYTGPNGRPAWNEFTGAVWQLSEVDNNRFFLVHLFATNDINHPIVAVQGITEYQNKPSGRDAAKTELNMLTGLPFAEFLPIATLICETADGYHAVCLSTCNAS